MNTGLKYVIGLVLLNCHANFSAIRSAVLEKITFDVAIFGNFPGYSRTEIVTSVPGYERPDVTL